MSVEPHFWGGDIEIRTQLIFLYNIPTHQLSSSYI